MLGKLLLVVTCWVGLAQPVAAAVTITFWSHDQDKSFPHAFFALEGTPDAGGAPIDANYGFTAKSVTPAILLGSVGGMVEDSSPAYLRRSDARFSVVLTDAQYAQIMTLISEWSQRTEYNLNKRNCVHFVAEAARRSGLTVPVLPKLMKKPRSFLLAVGEANPGRVTQINLDGKAYQAARSSAEPAVAARVTAAPVMSTVTSAPLAIDAEPR